MSIVKHEKTCAQTGSLNETYYTYHKDFRNVHESGPPILFQWKIEKCSYLEKIGKEKEKKRKRLEGSTSGRVYFKHPIISILKLASFSSLASIGIPYFSITFAVDVLVNQWKHCIELFSNWDCSYRHIRCTRT